MNASTLSPWDAGIVGGYFLLVIVFGVWMGRRGIRNTDTLFLADRVALARALEELRDAGPLGWRPIAHRDISMRTSRNGREEQHDVAEGGACPTGQ